jgi:uncharacterized protein HemY
MSELFHNDVPDDYVEAVCRVMERANWHTYQVLTKRSSRMRNMLQERVHFAARLPHDAAAHHNLGTLYLRTARYRAATDAYRQSLRHRPESAVTCVHLGDALKDAGDHGQAVAVWRPALDQAPGHPAAMKALRLAQAR